MRPIDRLCPVSLYDENGQLNWISLFLKDCDMDDIRVEVPYLKTDCRLMWIMYKEHEYLVLHPAIHDALMLLDAAFDGVNRMQIEGIGQVVFMAARRFYSLHSYIPYMEKYHETH